MRISEILDKNRLHHAYLLEGARDEMLAELLEFLENAGFRTGDGSEFVHMQTDAFKMEDARNLKAHGREKGYSGETRIFVVTANSILSEAQGSLLKLFEEPVPGMHFFLIMPDANSLTRTLLSRFYVIRRNRKPGYASAERFVAMRPGERIDFIKELIAEDEEEGGQADSARARAIDFLGALEMALHDKSSARAFPEDAFEHILRVRRSLRMPGSSVKMLMESVALLAPVIQ